MPTPTLAKNLAAKAGVSVDKVNSIWAEAEKQALKSKKKSDKDYWAYTTGIAKKMLGLKEDFSPVEETGAITLFQQGESAIHEDLVYTSIPKWRILEAAEPGKKWDKKYLAKVQGTLMEFGVQNQNGRRYPREIMEKIQANTKLKNRLNMRALVAQANHPSEGLNTDINKVAGVVTEWRFTPDNKMDGVLEILNTSSGRDVYELMKADIPVGVSARGSGDVDRNGDVITESYDLITFDIVIDPSFESAVPKIKEIMERLTRDSNALCEGFQQKKQVNKEENSNMFEQAMCFNLVLENVYYDLKAVFESTDTTKYFSYVKSYLQEAAKQYFSNEKCFSVDWNKFWAITEDVIQNHALYETQNMTDFNALKEQATMQVVANLHNVLKLILETYDHDVRKMDTKLEESFFMRYIGIVNKVSNLLETKSYKATKTLKEDHTMAFDEAKKDDELNQDDEFVLVDDDQDEEGEEAPKKKAPEVEEADCMLKDKRKDVKEGDDYAEKLKKDLPFDEDELPESDTHEGDTLADVTKDSNPKTDGMKSTSDNFAVKESAVKELAGRFGLTMNEAATVLLANKIVEAKIHKGKKPAKKAVTIAKKAAKKESVENQDKKPLNESADGTKESKAPDKIESKDAQQKSALHESTVNLVSACML